MQLYAVNFIPLLSSLYMFWAAHTPIIRSKKFNCIYSHWYNHRLLPVAIDTVELCTPDDGRVCTFAFVNMQVQYHILKTVTLLCLRHEVLRICQNLGNEHGLVRHIMSRCLLMSSVTNLTVVQNVNSQVTL